DCMKVLYVFSGNSGNDAAFILEQIASVPNTTSKIFRLKGKGSLGYLLNYFPLLLAVLRFRPQIIHAHYGLSGALVGMLPVWMPKIVTFHGSDINNPQNRGYSKFAHRASSKSIFVNEALKDLLQVTDKYEILPCGVDRELFRPAPQAKCREQLGLPPSDVVILFSSSFSNPVKNYPLARASVECLAKKLDQEVKLVELKGMSREEVSMVMNASDVCLLTSRNEGSPQFIKEALACGRPVVSTDVGDVRALFEGIERGTFLVDSNAGQICAALQEALAFDSISIGPSIEKLDINVLGLRLAEIYRSVR
ncbi:MAG: glycosyltransferase, partial [Cryomorphaceae bacterium]